MPRDRMSAELREKKAPPLLQVQTTFDPFMTLWRRPMRLVVGVLIPTFLSPELQGFLKSTTGIEGEFAHFIVVMAVMITVFIPPAIGDFLNARRVRFNLYENHVTFTENFLLREPIRIPYRSIARVSAHQGLLQKILGLSDIVITSETQVGRLQPRQHVNIIHDVRDASKIHVAVERIIQESHREAADKKR